MGVEDEPKPEQEKQSQSRAVDKTPEISTERQQLWDDKMRALQAPDTYGYVIDAGIRETVAALQLHRFNTTQSDQGNYSITPWVEFGADQPKDIYQGEADAKKEIMAAMAVSPEEIDPSSVRFDRSKQVDVEDTARERLATAGAALTKEFTDARQDTFQQVMRLQRIIDRYRSDAPTDSDLRVEIQFPYNEATRPEHIRHIPVLRVESVDRKDEQEDLGTARDRRRQEMQRFTEFLKNKFLTS